MKDQLIYILVDPFIVIGSFLIAYNLRHFGFSSIQPISFYIPFLAATVIVFLFAFMLLRLYGTGFKTFSLMYFVDFLKAYFLWGFILTALSYFSKTDYSRAVFLLFFICSGFLLYLFRFLVEWRRALAVPRAEDPILSKNLEEIVRFSKLYSGDSSILKALPFRRFPGVLSETGKRAFDCSFAIFTLLITSPFFPLIVLLIRLDSEGPAILSQERIGYKGRRFKLYKFRTMAKNTPLYMRAPERSDDPRITRMGRILRRYSIDELPQLLNVIKGDMSIVGPRPEMPFIAERYESWQKIRLEVKPGITGLWQILGRKDRPLLENIHYDLYYIYQRSFLLDLAIILETIPALFFPRGAY